MCWIHDESEGPGKWEFDKALAESMRHAKRTDAGQKAIVADLRGEMKVDDYKRLANPFSHCAVIIGIDPGVETGVAIGSAEDPTIPIDFYTMDFWKAHDRVVKFPPDHTGIVIEVPQGHVIHRSEDNNTRGFGRDRQAANVGSNRREATLLADRFEALGFPVVRVRPIRKKWTAEELKLHTGITARTNQHVRDAIRLVWERVS